MTSSKPMPVPISTAARMARVDAATIIDLIANGTLMAERINGKLYVDLEAVLRLRELQQDQ